MNICSPYSGDFAFSKYILFLFSFKLVGGESKSAFFFSLWSVHIVKLKLLHTESHAGLFTVKDPKILFQLCM